MHHLLKFETLNFEIKQNKQKRKCFFKKKKKINKNRKFVIHKNRGTVSISTEQNKFNFFFFDI